MHAVTNLNTDLAQRRPAADHQLYIGALQALDRSWTTARPIETIVVLGIVAKLLCCPSTHPVDAYLPSRPIAYRLHTEVSVTLGASREHLTCCSVMAEIFISRLRRQRASTN